MATRIALWIAYSHDLLTLVGKAKEQNSGGAKSDSINNDNKFD